MSCPLCRREAVEMQKHHLRTRRTDRDETEAVCRECHQMVHGLFSNRELRDPRSGLDSVEGLLADARVQQAVSFIRRIPPGQQVRMRLSNSARGGKRRWHG